MTNIRHPNILLKIFALSAALAVTACGDSSSDSGGAGGDPGGEVATILTMDSSLEFMPADITISAGDTVRFVMTATHNAIQVSMEAYDARQVTPLPGGFQVDFGDTEDITFDQPGVYYYVCTPHVTFDMVGTITVE
jgi:plastocyanin